MSEIERAALAWMRAQARALDPSIPHDAGVLVLSRVIAAAVQPRRIEACYCCRGDDVRSEGCTTPGCDCRTDGPHPLECPVCADDVNKCDCMSEEYRRAANQRALTPEKAPSP